MKVLEAGCEVYGRGRELGGGGAGLNSRSGCRVTLTEDGRVLHVGIETKGCWLEGV